jgi:hypothetical protein
MEQAAPGASELLRGQREKLLHNQILARSGGASVPMSRDAAGEGACATR